MPDSDSKFDSILESLDFNVCALSNGLIKVEGVIGMDKDFAFYLTPSNARHIAKHLLDEAVAAETIDD